MPLPLESAGGGQDEAPREEAQGKWHNLDAQTRQPTSLVAYLLGDDGAPSETVLARSRLKAKRDLPEYARPRHFLGLDALPISQGDSRKLDLSALPTGLSKAKAAA